MTDILSVPSETTPPFCLNLFFHLEQAQSRHGIPHQDYSQYSNYCSAKLSRLRHAKSVCTLLVHNQKYSNDGSGSGSKQMNTFFKRNELNPDSVPHENLFWILLFSAERAWSQACGLQQKQQLTLGIHSNGCRRLKSRHGHIQRRLNKAAKYADALAKLAAGDGGGGLHCDVRIVKECDAYHLWMKGNSYLEHKQYDLGFRHYKACLVLLLSLSRFSSSNSDAGDAKELLALQDVWTERAESIIRPLVRYCQYEARAKLTPEDLLLPTVGGTMALAETGTGDIEISFRNKTVYLDKERSYKELAVLYLKMEAVLKRPDLLLQQQPDEICDGNFQSVFLQLLSDLDDAIAIIQAELHRYENLPSGPNIISKRQELLVLLRYFRYQKLSCWGRQQEYRIIHLVNDGCDPEVLVHAFDALLQNAHDIDEVLQNEESVSSESLEDDAMWLEAQAHIIRIRAFKCFHLACLYESSPLLGGSSKMRLGLLRHVESLIARAKEEISAIDEELKENQEVNFAARDTNELDCLEEQTKCMTARVEAKRFLAKIGAGPRKTRRPLWLRLDELDAGEGLATLVDDPPLSISMTCKGIFYDIAFLYFDVGQLPIESIKHVIAIHEQKEHQSSGFFSWLTRSS